MTLLAAPQNRVERIMDRMTFKGKMWSGTRWGIRTSEGKGTNRMEKSTRNRDRE